LSLRKKYWEAQIIFEELSQLIRNVLPENHWLNPNIHLQKGYLYNSQGKYRLALDSYKKAELWYEKFGSSPVKKARLYYSLGILETTPNPQKAIGYFKKVLNLYQEYSLDRPNLTTVPGSYSSIGLAYEVLKEYEEAIGYLRKALVILREKFPESHPSLCLVKLNLGRLFAYNQQQDSSDYYFFESIECYSKGIKKDSTALLHPYFFLARANEDFANIVSAEEFYQKALRISKNSNFRDEFISLSSLTALISLSISNNKLEKAEDLLALAIEIATSNETSNVYEDIGSSEIEFSILIDLRYFQAKLLRLKGEKTESFQLLNQSLNSYKNTITEIDNSESFFKQVDIRFDFINRIAKIYDETVSLAFDLYESTQNADYLRTAFEIDQKKKGNVLLWRINKNEQEFSSKDFTQKKYIETLEEKIAQTKDKINYFKSQGDSALVEVQKKDLFVYQKSYDSLNYEFEKENSENGLSGGKTSIIELDDFQNSLNSSDVLVEYFRTETNLYAFAITLENASFQKLAVPLNFDRRLEEFLAEFHKTEAKWSGQSRRSFIKDSRYFFDILLRPLLTELGIANYKDKKKLIIVPDGNLAYIPFDMLLTDEVTDIYDYDDYPFLLKDFTIRSAYSATLLTKLRPPDQSRKQLFIGFAPGYISPALFADARKSGGGVDCDLQNVEEFRQLTQSEDELDAILNSLKGKEFGLLDASEKNFKENADKTRIIHLTMHGFTNNCDPMYSGLAFTPRELLVQAGLSDTINPTNEGILYAYEIYNMKIGAELVVMSACQTGLGKIQAGEGVMSLARAFAYAGSPNTVMSLWKVQEGPTRELMTSFYHHLSRGKGKDEALQLAKLDYLANNADAHPFYWAGFTLIGDDKPIVEDNWFQKNWWMLAIGLVLLLGIYAVLRKYSSSART